MSIRAEPGHGSEQDTGGRIDDGECRAGAITPHRHGVLDEGVGVSRQEWLGDRHPPSDLRVLADGKHSRCIGQIPRAQDQVVDGQDRAGFAVHRTILSVPAVGNDRVLPGCL